MESLFLFESQTDVSLEQIYCDLNLTAHLSRCSHHGHATHHAVHATTPASASKEVGEYTEIKSSL